MTRSLRKYFLILLKNKADKQPIMIKTCQTLALILCFHISVCELVAQSKPVNVIFDTDMGPDYDDVGAITMLHAFADKGEARILATMASTKYEGVAAVLNVFNTYFKRPDTPIGVPKGRALELKDFQHWTDTVMARYPHRIKTNSEVPDAVSLYRKVLSQEPDNSVTIITVGFLTNIASLLQSKGDGYSPLNGVELVRKKVNKLVSMAGRFPAGSEFNVREDAAAAKYAFENFPKPVLYSGVEIGFKIKSGLPLIHNTAIRNNPVKDTFRIGISKAEGDREGRMSWDQSAVLIGVRGYETWYNIVKGKIAVDEKGTNTWNANAGDQAYLIESAPVSEVTSVINEFMMHQPR
jgi:pyrimidine-specific ribonucleoside hydrolase